MAVTPAAADRLLVALQPSGGLLACTCPAHPACPARLAVAPAARTAPAGRQQRHADAGGAAGCGAARVPAPAGGGQPRAGAGRRLRQPAGAGRPGGAAGGDQHGGHARPGARGGALLCRALSMAWSWGRASAGAAGRDRAGARTCSAARALLVCRDRPGTAWLPLRCTPAAATPALPAALTGQHRLRGLPGGPGPHI